MTKINCKSNATYILCVYASFLFLQASASQRSTSYLLHDWETWSYKRECHGMKRGRTHTVAASHMSFYERYVRCAFIKLMRPFVDASCDVTSPPASSSGWITFASCLPSSTLYVKKGKERETRGLAEQGGKQSLQQLAAVICSRSYFLHLSFHIPVLHQLTPTGRKS